MGYAIVENIEARVLDLCCGVANGSERWTSWRKAGAETSWKNAICRKSTFRKDREEVSESPLGFCRGTQVQTAEQRHFLWKANSEL